MSFDLEVNGEQHTLDVSDQVPLLSAVRNYLGLFGTKYGCGVGKCGACIVHLDGVEKHSCQVTLGELEGESITTIEGFVRDNPDHPLLKAWLELEVPQCGYCQPGMIMNAASLLASTDDPDPETIAAQMDDICRCGTYPRAVRALAQAIDDMKSDDRSLEWDRERKALPANANDPVYEGPKLDAFSPNPWSAIDADGTITIYSPPAEMGQGSLTTLAVIYAEELDADWSKVRIEHSPTIDDDFGNPIFWAHGIMITVGSSTITAYYEPVRRLGAQARRVLLDNAAAHWDVPRGELTTEPSVVVHTATDRRMTYGEIAAFASAPDPLPEVEDSELKDPSEFRLIGHVHIPRPDILSKIDGTAVYSIDVDLPDMAFARVLQAPVKGAEVVSVDDGAARQLPGVVEVVELATGVGIVAENYEMAFVGGEMVQIEWGPGPGDEFDSVSELEVEVARARDLSDEGMALQDDGDTTSALADGAAVIDAVYTTDFMYQAHLEPLNAVARWSADGRLEMWAGSQAPTHLLRSLAQDLDIDEGDISLHRTYLGGGFGRRAGADHDWAVEAAQLARAVGRPVKAIRAREDDTRFGRFKPITAHYLRAAQTDGQLSGYHHRVVSDEPLGTSDPWRYEKNGFYPITSSVGIQTTYIAPNRKAEVVKHELPVWLSPMRGVGGTLNKFASESFIDELAAAAGVDPLDYRLQHLDDPIAHSVLRTVAAMANWDNPGGRHLGLSYVEVDEIYVATIAQVDRPADDGTINVRHVWAAIDVGVVVTPHNAIAQAEGAVIFSVSNTLKERITYRQGRVQQSTFEDYHLLALNEAPDVTVHLLESTRHPKGLGDLAGMGVAPAIANAVAATGTRVRHLPLTPDHVQGRDLR